MLTTVYLDGAMGKKFGSKWELSINSPREALSLIDANKPGLLAWIKAHLTKFSRYRVVCEYHDGRSEDICTEEYPLERKLKSLRFVPIVEGAGSAAKFVIGVVLVVAGAYMGQTWMMQMGIGMMLGGLIGMLSPQPQSKDPNTGESLSSNYFDGPANTTQQGAPVQLIYGKKVMVGSQIISAAMDIQ